MLFRSAESAVWRATGRVQPCCRLVPENAEFVWYWCDLFGDQCAAGVCEVQGTGDDFRELVRSSTNLVDLVAETVTLKPLHGGRQYVGLCPFHDDHNPSFYVYPDRQSYRCWVCQQGGDCFRWVMEIEKLSFPEAMESLARRDRKCTRRNSSHE